MLRATLDTVSPHGFTATEVPTEAGGTTTALIEFEVKRDPNRGNGEIAKACRSSIPAVAKARKRLGYDEPVRA